MTDSRICRQGDILLVPTEIPKQASHIRRKEDGYPEVKGIVLAAGEATGHHHVVTDPWSRLYQDGRERFLRVSKRGARLVHEEHDTIDLGEGEYRIQRQREYDPPKAASAPARTRRVWD